MGTEREDAFYEAAMRELLEKRADIAAFAKALAASGGDENTTKSLYIKYRVVTLQRESVEAAEAAKVHAAKLHKEKLEAEAAYDEAIKKKVLAFRARHPGCECLTDQVQAGFWKREEGGENIDAEIAAAIRRSVRSNYYGYAIALGLVVLVLLVAALSNH